MLQKERNKKKTLFYIKSNQINQDKDWYIEKLDQNGLKYR
jgi:hypothetical protein